jgi:hypothetical protein
MENVIINKLEYDMCLHDITIELNPKFTWKKLNISAAPFFESEIGERNLTQLIRAAENDSEIDYLDLAFADNDFGAGLLNEISMAGKVSRLKCSPPAWAERISREQADKINIFSATESLEICHRDDNGSYDHDWFYDFKAAHLIVGLRSAFEDDVQCFTKVKSLRINMIEALEVYENEDYVESDIPIMFLPKLENLEITLHHSQRAKLTRLQHYSYVQNIKVKVYSDRLLAVLQRNFPSAGRIEIFENDGTVIRYPAEF